MARLPARLPRDRRALASMKVKGLAARAGTDVHGRELFRRKAKIGDGKNLEAGPVSDKEKVRKIPDFSGKKACGEIVKIFAVGLLA